MNAAEAPETVGRYTRAAEIGHLDLFGGPHHHIFDLALAVYQNADLAARFMRELGHLARQFGRNDLLSGNTAGAEALDPP
jgi:hypothetical protein